jgi:hypothetical protein
MRLLLFFLATFLVARPALAQAPPPAHDHPMPADASSLDIAHARDASGTSVLPEIAPDSSLMWQRGRLMLMLHGRAFVQYINAGSDRPAAAVGGVPLDDDWFGSTNWVMGMAQLPLAGGQLQLRTMLSAEPATVGRCGYPNLLQTGELCRGFPLHDRQHPHDLFMELAARYRRPLTSSVALELYGGPAGEPALGPAGFPHRLSAAPNPMAPISHHWLDSTHISFGVVTAGLYGRKWKGEGSIFNGREPNDRRYDIIRKPLDSYSGRFWLFPAPQWAIQVSAGRLKEPDYLHFFQDVDRYTASVTHHRLIGEQLIATTVAWGLSRDPIASSSAFLAETTAELSERDVVFGRAEIVGKSEHELDLPHDHANMQHGVTSQLNKLQLGYTRRIASGKGLTVGAGGSAGISMLPLRLSAAYGGSRMVGEASVFLSVGIGR